MSEAVGIALLAVGEETLATFRGNLLTFRHSDSGWRDCLNAHSSISLSLYTRVLPKLVWFDLVHRMCVNSTITI